MGRGGMREVERIHHHFETPAPVPWGLLGSSAWTPTSPLPRRNWLCYSLSFTSFQMGQPAWFLGFVPRGLITLSTVMTTISRITINVRGWRLKKWMPFVWKDQSNSSILIRTSMPFFHVAASVSRNSPQLSMTSLWWNYAFTVRHKFANSSVHKTKKPPLATPPQFCGHGEKQ